MEMAAPSDGLLLVPNKNWQRIRDTEYVNVANNMRKNSVQYTTLLYFHGNGPTRVFLFWSEAGKFQICNQNSEKKLWILSIFTVKLPEEAKGIEIFPKFQVLNQLSRMKGGVELLSIAKRTIDFVEAIFHQLCPVLN